MTFSEQKILSGFKQTDAGVIPEDWDVAPLIEICGFGGGTTPPRSQHDRYFVGGSNNWIKTTDLNNSLIGLSEEQITEVALSETGLKKHPVGTVLVAMYGGFNQIGRTGLITKPSAINQALVAVKPKPKKLNSYYLLSELNYNVDYWKGVASSSRKDPNITSNDVKNYKIALPPVEEQTAIANALSDVDALLTELEKLIAKKQAIKTASMQQLLTGKTRLPQFATYTEGAVEGKSQGQPKGTKPSELGEIPEDWDVITIDEALSKKMIIDQMDGNHGELYPKSHEFSQDGVPYVGATDFYDGIIDYKSCKKLPLGRAKKFKKGIALNGDILFAHNATVGPTTLVETEEDFIIISTTATYFRCDNEKLKNTYLLSFFKSDLFVKQFSAVMSQSTRNQVPILAQRKFYIAIPSIEEQTAIATILSDMDNEIQILEQRLAKTRQIKQGMMQELLTGKMRLIRPLKEVIHE